jgi:hypothetical protein
MLEEREDDGRLIKACLEYGDNDDSHNNVYLYFPKYN